MLQQFSSGRIYPCLAYLMSSLAFNIPESGICIFYIKYNLLAKIYAILSDLSSMLLANKEIKAVYLLLFNEFGSIILLSMRYSTNFLLLAFAAMCKQVSPDFKSLKLRILLYKLFLSCFIMYGSTY